MCCGSQAKVATRAAAICGWELWASDFTGIELCTVVMFYQQGILFYQPACCRHTTSRGSYSPSGNSEPSGRM